MRAINGSGKNVPFGAELGRGGEGSVYEITSANKIVAKVYHQALHPKKQEKIQTMVHLKQDSLLKFSTWPVDILKDPNNEIIGFIMPRLTGKEIHKLYGPKTRVQEFPQATYAFLVHTSANLARAFAAVHDSGHVIGDVNHGNFYVTDQGTVMLVDCDSFQIQTQQHVFRCEVGIPMYQPPELQQVTSYRDLERSPNHDNFGLAVFIFMLLFMGRHPFAGVYGGSEDMPIEKAISQHRFAYSKDAAAKLMKPPPGAAPLSTVPPAMAQMFERAFAIGGATAQRPKAEEWVHALQTMAGNLRKCAVKNNHQFSNHLAACPWCELEQKTGIILFSVPVQSASSYHGNYAAQSTFHLQVVWSKIKAISAPTTNFTLPSFSGSVLPSSEAVMAAKKMRRKRVWGFSAVVACIGPLLYFFPEAWVIIALVSCVMLVTLNKRNKTINTIKERYMAVKQRKDMFVSEWDAKTDAKAFYDKYRALESAKKDYDGLEQLRKTRLQELQSKQREKQMERHLQNARIANATIDGIGPSRKATLQSFGIETAADVSYGAIQNVPGFGPKYTKRLMTWRQSVERTFLFNSKQSASPAELAALHQDIDNQKQRLENQLLGGVSHLQELADQIQSKRTQLLSESHTLVKEFMQAEADYQAVSKWL